MKEVFIVTSKRTPVGAFLGGLSDFSAIQLGAAAIKAVVPDESLAQSIDAVYMGNVLSANLGQSPARQAAIAAGLRVETDCTTVNKVCSSGLKSVIIGSQQIQLGQADLIVAGGMESMSNTPHYSQRRKINKLGDEKLIDGLLKDGLTDAYHNFHMGNAAELCVREFGLTREEQDDYALASYEKAQRATSQGKFLVEIVPIETKNGVIREDEDIIKVIPEKVPKLKPAFDPSGSITAANASNLNDGAAAILLASAEAVAKYQLQPIAKVLSYADAAQAPEKFPTSPALAIRKALGLLNYSLDKIDFFEINEAYAAVILANRKLLDLDLNKVNVYGGAVAIGHPLGASGARILCTLTSVLHQERGRYGVAAICNGGGGASAMVIERL
jgi:acetyl-CoA C-acetyltransferase